ncbi:MAG TPA: c-type cytochrome [Acidobacteriota bacterium]|nr:c-type cytochrome [Acidobacteriota bacterium]
MSATSRIPGRRRLAFFALLAVLAWAAPAQAQIPDTFTNLQALPKDMKKPELVSMMRGISGALGVRCGHCHAGGDPETLKGVDFASDEKKEKKIARAMMKMVGEINGTLLPTAGIESPMEVRCVTCHRGLKKPETLDQAMIRTARTDGAAAAIAEYRKLRADHYGAGGYDFRPRTLNLVAEWMANEGANLDGAIEVTKLNVEMDPGVANSHGMLGRLYVAKGDKAAAVAAFRKALELDPSDRRSKDALEKLEKE